MFDVLVAGLGPAGRALASQCAQRGLNVHAVDPRPDGIWTPTYGLWADQLDDLPAEVVRSRVHRPRLRATSEHVIERDYVVLDNDALQRALPLDGVDVAQGQLSDADLADWRGRARVVVDARGARVVGAGGGADRAPAQTAYGVVVPEQVAAPVLAGAEGVLMDWRPDWALDPTSPRGVATFLYAIPLGGGQVLLEETCLAAAPGMPVPELRRRLERRLARHGVGLPELAGAPSEVVRIPMLGRDAPPRPGVMAVGTAGRGGHPVTGYSVAHSLAMAPALAEAIASGGPVPQPDPWTAADAMRHLGLRSLLRLDAAGTMALFEAFGQLRPDQQSSFFSRTSPAGDVTGAMWSMFTSMGWADRRRLVRASFGPGATSG